MKQTKRAVIGVGVAIVVALGFISLTRSGSDTQADTAFKQYVAPNGQPPPGGRPGGPGQLTEFTGSAAPKVKAAAKAKVGGTVDHVVKDPSGGYLAMVTESDGTRVLVKVNTALKVTSTQAIQGPPNGGGQGQDQAAPSGSGPSPTTQAS